MTFGLLDVEMDPNWLKHITRAAKDHSSEESIGL
jgi:hypothetical protein